MKTKLYTLFFAILVSFGMMHAEVYSGTCGDDLTWSLNTEDSILTIAGTGAMTDFSIAPWFGYSRNIKSILLPSGLTYIGDRAFSGFTNLTSITIPNSVISIGENVFGGCTGLTSPVYNAHLFAFMPTSYSGSYTIQDGIEFVTPGAFINCKKLTSITIPNSVTTIGSEAFQSCDSLASVYISDIAAWCRISFSTVYSNPLYYAKRLFLNGSEVTNLVIPNSVTSIGNSAFYGCTSLTSITIPSSVTSIGNSAFHSCSGLTSVTIPNSVTSIGNNAFSMAPNIVYYGTATGTPWGARCVNGYIEEELVYSDATKTSLLACFPNKIGDVVIPNSVASIGGYAFYKCYDITNVNMPNSVMNIGKYAFANCSKMVSINISNAVKNIGIYAFYNCSTLTDIVIPNSVDTIGKHAFHGCSGLISATIGNNVTTIENSVFLNCARLKGIEIPNSVTSINGEAFYGCSGMTSVHISDMIAWCHISFGNVYSNPLYYAHHLFLNDTEVTNLQIPSGITSIGNYAFSNCLGITSLDIPESVTSLGKCAFQGCTNLVTVNNNSSSFALEAGVLDANNSYCTYYATDVYNLYDMGINGTCGTNLTWNLTVVGVLTISGTGPMENYTSYSDVPWYSNSNGIKSVIILDGVTSIGDYAFSFCHKLTSIKIPNSVTSIGKTAFLGSSALASVTIPNGVTSIGESAFFYCSGLTSVTIGNSVTSIGDLAFDGCSNLTTITIGNSVTSIGSGVFRDCKRLTSVTWNAKNCSDFTRDETPFYYYYIGSNNAISDLNFDIRAQLTSFVFGDDVEYIPAYLCGGMKNAEIIISNCKTQIGTNALSDCNYRVEGVYNIILRDTILCYNEDLYLGGVKCPLTKKANTKQTWTQNLTTTNGCDSTITISVEWRKFPDFTITTKDEFDTPNSGSISYKKTDSNYFGKFYYTLNGIRNASLSYLSAGTYQLVFHSDDNCDDAVVKTVQINRYGMKINGQYYLLDDNNNTATLTYRGAWYDSYRGEYSGNIVIPKTITFQNKTYQVTGINTSTFEECNNIQSITIEAETLLYMKNSGLPTNCIVYVPYGLLNSYKADSNWKNYNLHVINPSHAAAITGATSVSITFGNADEQKHIASCGVEGGEQTAGYILDYTGLDPNSEYKDVPFSINTKERDCDIISISFTTSALELTTQPSKPVSSTTAILLANTNMADIETSCGFEWKRNDMPDDYTPTKVYCPIANGTMAGRLKNLKDDVLYKYRAFYQSKAGNMYYGDWQYIFTGDVAIEFDPILYTYAATAVSENEATLKGYALAGSDDFTEQGFEYWSESRTNGTNAPYRMPAALGEHHTITTSGISMKTTLTNLDAGTVYRYRTYAKIGNQILYGSEMTFTTQGEYVPPTYMITFVDWDGTELQKSPVEENTLPVYAGQTPVRAEDEQSTYTFSGWTPEIVIATADATYTATYTAENKSEAIDQITNDQSPITNKIIKDNQIFILRGDHTYTVDGRLVR